MKKLQNKKHNKTLSVAGFFVLGILTGTLILFGIARLTWHSKFYPGVSIANVDVSGLTREQAQARLTESIQNYELSLVFNGAQWITPKNSVEYDLEQSLNSAYQLGRRVKIDDYLLLLANRDTDFPLIVAEGKTDKMEQLIAEIASAVEIPPIDPVIDVVANKINIANGSDGTLLDGQALDLSIRSAYANLSSDHVTIPTVSVKKELGSEELAVLQERAQKMLPRSIQLSVDDDKIRVEGEVLMSMLSTDGSEKLFNSEHIEEYVVGLGTSLNKEPQDAKFEYSGGRVQEFAPSKDGVVVEIDATSEAIEQALTELLAGEIDTIETQIVVKRIPPSVTMDKVNELGIKERIGRGESYYAHSIPNRIYNVGLAAERANTALIAPGEEFSFNKVVGEISGATGYRTAYVISGGRTVLGDGGGVCQVSTTLFRGAMSAGLPITERWAHAYRVGYYEQNSKPGIDATVYSPSKDLRFLNDTPGHILVQTINDPKNLHLVVEIYGTSDGRVATVSEPKVWGITGPLPTVYQDDPSLPAGVVKQVDWSAPGAKTSFEYKVVRNGETLQDKTFTSAYRPWAAVYLRGTGQ